VTNPASAYIARVVQVDALLGRLIAALQEVGAWSNTYLIVAADHGMGLASSSTHPASTPSSWNPFMAFHGPGLKQGASIPYAELPDLAVTAAHLLGLRPLQGHLDAVMAPPVAGPTGTVLTNLFAGAPDDIPHPRYVQRCLDMGTACTSEGDDFGPYREAMLALIR
jgi:arylsulfatase A-like enzyme